MGSKVRPAHGGLQLELMNGGERVTHICAAAALWNVNVHSWNQGLFFFETGSRSVTQAASNSPILPLQPPQRGSYTITGMRHHTQPVLRVVFVFVFAILGIEPRALTALFGLVLFCFLRQGLHVFPRLVLN